jgi:hypothetical protein
MLKGSAKLGNKKTNGPKIIKSKGSTKKSKVKIKQPTEPKPHN